MDNLPKELEEDQIKLEVVVDPETNCLTMKTRLDIKTEIVDSISAEIVPKEDPLLHSEMQQVDFEKMSELDQLIYLERQRLLNLKPPKKAAKRHEINKKLSRNEKARLRMKQLREEESEEDHEFRKFRGRIKIMKTRLIQKLRNFENETYLEEIKKRASEKVKQKRLELKEKETPAQQALRKKQVNMARSRMFLRNKAFRTPEDLLLEKEKRTRYIENTWSRLSEEQRNAKRKSALEKAKNRRKQNEQEWKSIQMAIKGKTAEQAKAAPEESKNK